ncbi:unnamed protein product [Amoebophrya sp. A25]|nr:unnamed protein product [Amoebophrya sp. A25]|eukprot:GSA25T00002185001.1
MAGGEPQASSSMEDVLTLRFKVNRFGTEATTTFHIPRYLTIAEIRANFFSAELEENLKVRLFYSGKYLSDDNCTLQHYEVPDGSCVHCFITKSLQPQNETGTASASAPGVGDTETAATAVGSNGGNVRTTVQIGGRVFHIGGFAGEREAPAGEGQQQQPTRHWLLERFPLAAFLQNNPAADSLSQGGANPTDPSDATDGSAAATPAATRAGTFTSSSSSGPRYVIVGGTSSSAAGGAGNVVVGRPVSGQPGLGTSNGTRPSEGAGEDGTTQDHVVLDMSSANSTRPGSRSPTRSGRPTISRAELISTTEAPLPAGANSLRPPAGQVMGLPRRAFSSFIEQMNQEQDFSNAPEECRMGIHRDMMTIWPTLPGLLCAFCFYPYGLCCCFLHKVRRCPRCGYTVHSC